MYNTKCLIIKMSLFGVHNVQKTETIVIKLEAGVYAKVYRHAIVQQ